MKGTRKLIAAVAAVFAVVIIFGSMFFTARALYPRPYRDTVRHSGLPESLVYAVIKTESGFREHAVSRAGAVGLMQLLPSTAEFICRKEQIVFEPSRLTEGKYNILLGCKYFLYLLGRFSEPETVIAAYNAGEGTVSEWLQNSEYSEDGKTLIYIPYKETSEYLKKIKKNKKIYEFFYDKT